MLPEIIIFGGLAVYGGYKGVQKARDYLRGFLRFIVSKYKQQEPSDEEADQMIQEYQQLRQADDHWWLAGAAGRASELPRGEPGLASTFESFQEGHICPFCGVTPSGNGDFSPGDFSGGGDLSGGNLSGGSPSGEGPSGGGPSGGDAGGGDGGSGAGGSS